MKTIRAIDLARNTREILDHVVSRREAVAVERNRLLIAQITPPERTITAAQALAGLQLMLTPKQGAAWLQDSQQDFDNWRATRGNLQRQRHLGRALRRLGRPPVLSARQHRQNAFRLLCYFEVQ